jgi:copper resistance protein C
MYRFWKSVLALQLLALMGLAGCTWAHVFPQHAEPKVGAVVAGPPSKVRIRFTGALEPAISSIRVEAEGGKRVDRGDSGVSSSDNCLLEVSLEPLPPGVYRVLWSVVSRDGHRTQGSYTFTIRTGQ